jgi:hypothetical protein
MTTASVERYSLAAVVVYCHSVLQEEQLLAKLAGTFQPGVAAAAVLLGVQVTGEAWGFQSHWHHCCWSWQQLR